MHRENRRQYQHFAVPSSFNCPRTQNAENVYTLYDSVVILALPLVTLTPSCLARATISIRFFDETALAILDWAC
jgi:hypothetical protein